jgi:hypothetical protein
MKVSDQPRVGCYRLRGEYVELFGLTYSDGGESYLCPQEGRLARIKVGLKQEWADTVGTLVHEALEMCLVRQNCVYQPTHSGAVTTSATCLYIVPHTALDEASEWVGIFLVTVLPDLKKVWTLARQQRRQLT